MSRPRRLQRRSLCSTSAGEDARVLMPSAEDLGEVTTPGRQPEYLPVGLGVHVVETEYDLETRLKLRRSSPFGCRGSRSIAPSGANPRTPALGGSFANSGPTRRVSSATLVRRLRSARGIRAEGRVAVVTGASRGIGRAVVDELVAEGVKVVKAGARNLSRP